MDIEELKRKVNAIGWHHTIDLGNGIVTPGLPAQRLERIGMPENLAERTVLDIGAWDGLFSFEAHRRGASRVLATDSYVWAQNKKGCSNDGFLLARSVIAPDIEDMHIDVLDLSPEKIGGTFDLVLFLGVLYHMRHPLLALERVFSVTGDMAIIESATDMLEINRPAMGFYAGSEYGADPTNWCGPNPPAIAAMLQVVGFRKIQKFSETRVHYRKPGVRGVSPTYQAASPAKKVWTRLVHKVSAVKSSPDQIPATRVVFHAWK